MNVAHYLVLVRVEGNRLPRPGSERADQVREAIWEAVDGLGEIWAIDDNGKEHGPLTLSCDGVAPRPEGRGDLP